MSPLRLTVRRTVGQSRGAYLTSLIVAAFVSAVAVVFSLRIFALEGSALSPSAVWSSAAAVALPVLAAMVGMGVWSDEFRTGRIDMLLSSPVPVIDFTIGKFLGVWTVVMFAALLSLVSSVAVLRAYAPACAISPLSFLVAFLALAVQGALWTAASLAASALCPRAAVAACLSVAVTTAVPRGLWALMRSWSVEGAPAWGEFPVDAHVMDLVSGTFSGGTFASYLILTALALLFCSVAVDLHRQAGRNVVSRRLVSVAVLGLSSVLAALLVSLAVRLDFTFDIPVSGSASYSERTTGILSEAYGEIGVTCFMSRSDKRFRPMARSLRRLEREASLHGGATLRLRFVDPTWDMAEASRLVRAGVASDSVVFANSRRSVVLSVDDAFSERSCASAILRLTAPPQRQIVRWTCGHGEASFADYGPFGMSDIARELARDGYGNQSLDLSTDATIPIDCALVIVAGAREEFSRAECARLEAYLRQGGRLLVMVNSEEAGGIASVLSGWGVNIVSDSRVVGGSTGDEITVRCFSDHAITYPLKGTSLVLDRPVAFRPSAAVGAASRADRTDFVPLASVGDTCVAAIAERGAQAGSDIGLRPTRIVVVGDASFVMNGMLASRANANCDFFLNAVACLSGTDAMTSGGASNELLHLGMERRLRRRFLFVGAVAVPAVLGAALFLIAFFRRRRK